MQHAYTAIGQAVFFAQLFEVALVPIFEGFKMQTDPDYLQKTSGYINVGTYKTPIKNIIKALSAEGNIAPDLEERLNRYVDNRNKLVHGWVRENGWPADNDAKGFEPIIQLANQVAAEAKELTRNFAGYMVMYGNAENSNDYKQAMAQLFQRAHIEGA